MSWAYPWTMHIDITNFRAYGNDSAIFTTGPSNTVPVLKRVARGNARVSISKLNASRDVLDRLFQQSKEFDHTATFALGGFVPLYFFASRLGAYKHNRMVPQLHLFPGLGWGAPPAIRDTPFTDFLISLKSEESVLIFDVGSVGHGVISAAKHIRTLLREKRLVQRPRIKLIGIVDGTYKKQAQAQEDLKKRCAKSGVTNIELEFMNAPIRVLDDACHLQGYIQMRQEARMQPYTNAGSVTFVDDAGNNVLSAGAANSAGVFLRVFVDGLDYIDPRRFDNNEE